MNIGTPTLAQLDELILTRAHLDGWLQRHKFTWGQLKKGKPIWPVVGGGLMPLTIADVEELIGIEDPVAWAYLNLVERETLILDGKIVVKAGDPWRLFPVQAQLARTHGDLLVECGSEVGKTRDIVLRTLWRADTREGPGSAMVGGDSDQTLIPIWEEMEFQLEQNPSIGGGLDLSKCHIKPNRKKTFQNGSTIELRLAQHDGRNFRGGHFSDGIYGDECVKWKSRKQWSEFWRAGKPGSTARVYSTPDGDYSCPFYSMSARATPINGPKATPLPDDKKLAPAAKFERKLKKFHISKRQLPAPFWSPEREAELTDRYGGQHTVEWITNVEGGWGSPQYSIFPMHALEPCLRFPQEYRMVRVSVDRQQDKVQIVASKLNPEAEGVDVDAPPEEILYRENGKDFTPLSIEDCRELGREIASFFPDMTDWVDPVLVCGGDLGSAEDPVELLFSRVIGKKWKLVYRLHLRYADWNVISAVVVQLDHASGHRVKYSFDNGSAGSALIHGLTQGEGYRECPECPVNDNALILAERLHGRGFGESIDDMDMDTGMPNLNPDDLDRSGDPKPYRISNKEFATRVLERKMALRDWEVPLDGGAGDQRMAGHTLLVNHTASGRNKKGERNFRGKDDHYVDAWRQTALEIVSWARPERELMVDGDMVYGSGQLREGSVFGAGSVMREFSSRPRISRGSIFG